MKGLIYRHDFLGYFFGTNDYALVLACFVYGCIGMFIMMLIDIINRDESSKRTPPDFSIQWFFKDNKARFLLNFLLMLVFMRFSADFLREPISPKSSVIIGFFSDVIAIIVRNKKKKALSDAEGGKITSFRSVVETDDNGEKTKKEVSQTVTETNLEVK